MAKFLINRTNRNPFQDGSNFDNFDVLLYEKTSEKMFADANLSTPLNIYKYILLKVNLPEDHDNDPKFPEKMMGKLKEVKAKYIKFERKKIPMLEKEQKYVRSANASLELAAMAIYAKLKRKEYLESIQCAGKVMEFKSEVINVQKLKQICTDILECNNPLREGIVGYLSFIQSSLQYKRSYEVTRFILCMMGEGLKKSRQVIIENGARSLDQLDMMETFVVYKKFVFFAQIFDVSSTLLTIGSAPYLESAENDEKDGRNLMELFQNCQDVDDSYKIPMIAKTYEQAKQLYELLQKLISEIKPENFQYKYDKDYWEGHLQSYFAAFHTEPEEIYRLCESSSKVLESIRIQMKFENSPKNQSIMVANAQNLRRMWNIKYEIYQQNKTQENFRELMKMVRRSINWSVVFLELIDDHSTNLEIYGHILYKYNLYGYMTYMDIAKCIILFYNDQSCATGMALKAYLELKKSPNQIPVFNNYFKGIYFHRNMSGDAFVRAVFKKFDPNIKIKDDILFEDNTGFEDFMCFPYLAHLSCNGQRGSDLKTPLNAYKYLLLMSLAAYNNMNDETVPTKLLKKNFKLYEKTYKNFMRQEISMTVEERKYVRSAHDTLRLAEMCSNYFAVSKAQKFQIKDFENSDIEKLKNICRSILDGDAKEVPLLFLNKIFIVSWRFRLHEICRFLLCVINEIKRKTRLVHEKNETMLKCCICTYYTIRDTEMRANHWNLFFFEKIFPLSSFEYTVKSVRIREERSTKASEIGKMLMGVFENYEEKEFQEVPMRANNYDQAKMMFEFMLKLSNERKCTLTIQREFDSYYYDGIAYGCFAAFVTDPTKAYKLCDKSVELLKSCLYFDKDNNKIEDVTNNDYILGAISENYRRMWNIKFDIYKQDESTENRVELIKIAAMRSGWGEKYLMEFDEENESDWPYPKWWTRLDLIKCYLQVKKDKIPAEKCAKDLYCELQEEYADIELFNAIAGVNFNCNMTQKKFVKLVIQKFSNNL